MTNEQYKKYTRINTDEDFEKVLSNFWQKQNKNHD